MGKYNLVTIRPKGFLHSSAFSEVKESLGWALSYLGHQSMSTENAYSCSPDSVNIVFGAELLSPSSEIPPNSILYNFEQPSHPAMANVEKLAAGKLIWDYHPQNVVRWQQLGIPVVHVPVGYTPNLTRIPAAENPDIDVFFAGWMTPRRSKLIQTLRVQGLKVVASDSCYGGARDQLISRAKLCLNVNHDGRKLFNVVRCSYLFANRKLVLSETSEGMEPWQIASCACAEYENLVSTAQSLLQSDSESIKIRADQAEWAYQEFSRQDYIATVEQALNSTYGSPIQKRYAQGLKEGDMKDFLPTLRSLAKGEILEIGVRDGASTSALLLGLEEHGGHLYSIDIQNCSQLWSHAQWTFEKMDSQQASFPEHRFDMALIDGDHSAEGFRRDLENCLRWVRPGGMILCHDISPLPNYTQEAAGGDWPSQYVGEEFFKMVKQRQLRYSIYPGAWGLGVIVKDYQ